MLNRRVVQGLATLVCFSVGAIAFAGTEGSISGKLVDSQGIALSGVPVQLLSPDGKVIRVVQSSLTGEYLFFPVVFGQYQISVHQTGSKDYVATLSLGSSGNSNLDITLIPEKGDGEMVVEVKAKRRLIQSTVATSSTEVNQAQIAKLPQGGEVSLPKLIAMTTPGVVQGPFGQTFIRGNHANIQYQIDGVQLPDSPSNTFGQAVSPRNIDHMEVITGGIPAEYGQRLSGVVNIVTKSGTEKPGGEIELNYGAPYNTLSPHLLYGGSNESGNLHYFVSANYNQTDRGLDTPQPESYENQMQGGRESTHNFASGHSEFSKIDWQMDNANKLSLILFNAQSKFQIPNYPSTLKITDPYFQPGYTDQFQNTQGSGSPTYTFVPSDRDTSQTEMNSYAQMIWKHTFNERAFLQVAPYYKYSSIKIDNDLENDLFSFGRVTGATPSSFTQDRQIHNLGVKTDYTLRANDNHLIKTGVQVQASRAQGSVNVVSIQDTSGGRARTTWSDNSPNLGYLEGVYLQDDITLAKPLILNAGLRFDAAQFSFGGLNSADSLFQPRLGLNYMATDTTKFHLFYGKLFQPASIETLRYQYDPQHGSFVSLDAFNIQAEKADFYEFGIAQQFAEQQVAGVNVYYKDGINILDDGQIPNTSIAQPYNFATGFAYGVEFSVKGQLSADWSEYANYSYSIAQGKGISGGTSDEATNSYQMLDHIQVHTANAGLTYSKNYFWWTTQGLYGSGLRTGPNNNLSLPGHFTMDTTVGYQFHGENWFSKFKISTDILNIFDNRYPITIANGYNSSHYAAGRQVFVRFTREL